MDFAELEKCTDLRDAHIVHAVTSTEAMEALLARFAELAAPGKGAPIILAALARLGTTACDWIDGELRIELSGDATSTKIAVSTSIGAGFREKLFADTILRVPLEELRRGIARAPRLIEPLSVKDTGRLLVLTVTQEVRRTSMPPPMVQIDPTSLMEQHDAVVVPKMAVPGVMNAEPPRAPAPKVVLRRRPKDEKGSRG